MLIHDPYELFHSSFLFGNLIIKSERHTLVTRQHFTGIIESPGNLTKTFIKAEREGGKKYNKNILRQREQLRGSDALCLNVFMLQAKKKVKSRGL